MIELPEAQVISEQMAASLTGRRIVDAVANTSPHRFAFYEGPPEAYADRMRGLTLGPAAASGNMILLPVGPELRLVLGEGGERILLHAPGAATPARHQLWLALDDSSHLTVSIQGWGRVGLMDAATFAAHPYVGRSGTSPLHDDYTLEHFQTLFDGIPADSTKSCKACMISEPGVWGMGNGCLQDVLFHARLHPRRRAASLTRAEQEALYTAMRTTLQQMIDGGGRDSELDLYGHPGGYVRLLHSKTVGQPCPVCAAPIEKQSYLGGSVYFCPNCQPLS